MSTSVHPEKQHEIEAHLFVEGVIKTAEEYNGSDSEKIYDIVLEGGTGFGLAAHYCTTVPQIGDTIRLYTHQGSMIHGVDHNGQELYYKDRAEQEREREERNRKLDQQRAEEFVQNESALDADYASLPDHFKKRIDKFRNNRADWRVQFEAYEMSACTDAVKIAAYCREHNVDFEGIEKPVRFIMDDLWDQVSKEKGLFDGHSGNSASFACALAYYDLTDQRMVYYEHGALTPLVGCTEYGCPHPYDPDGVQEQPEPEPTTV